MRKLFTPILSAFILAAMLWSCGDAEPKVVPVEELETYTDEAVKFEVMYPSNWYVAQKTIGLRYLVFTSQNGMERFRSYAPEGPPAAKIEVTVAEIDSSRTVDTLLKKAKMFAAETYTDPEKVMIDGVECTKVEYAFEVEDGPFHGAMYIGAKDTSRATILTFEAFEGTWETYKDTFDKIVKNFKLAVAPADIPDTIFRTEEYPPPSEEFKTVSGNGFSIQIPENFSKEGGAYFGKRRGDSYIRVDVASVPENANLKKSVDQSHAKFPGAGQIQKTTLDGQEAYKFPYRPSGSVDGEAYFTIKDGKLYQITINWFKGEAEDYKPVFQKSVQTFSFK